MEQLKRLIREIHRRSIWQVIAIYLFGSWAAVEVVQTLSESLGLPQWFPALAVVLLIIGFPVVVATAFVQEGAPASVEAAAADPAASTPPTDPPASLLTWRNALAGGLVATVFWALVAGAWLTFVADRDSPPTGSPDRPVAGLVAIFPFRVPSEVSELAHLGEGMVDLLAAKLTGEGGVQAVDPRAAISAWRRAGAGGDSAITRDALIAAATALGAGRLIDGGVVSSGGTIFLSADLLEVPGGERLAGASVQGPPDSVLTLAEELTARLLIEGEAQGARLDALMSTSLPALRAYLDGQRAYRAGSYAQAAADLARAISIDSTFAVAALSLRRVGQWGSDVSRGRNDLAERVAWANVDRLDPADRALLEAMTSSDYPRPSSARERLAALRKLVDMAPSMPEAWFELGDHLFHAGAQLGLPDAVVQAERAFARGLKLDPGLVASLEHLIEVNARLGDTADVRRYSALYFPDARGDLLDYYRWRAAQSLGDSDALEALIARANDMSENSLRSIVGYSALDGTSMPEARRMARALERRIPEAGEEDFTRLVLRQWYLNGGRPSAAARIRRSRDDEVDRQVWRLYEALWWDGDEDAAEGAFEVLRRLLEEESADPEQRLDARCGVAEWELLRGSSVERARALIRDLRTAPPYPPEVAPRAALCAVRLEVLVERARGGEVMPPLLRLDQIAREGAMGGRFDYRALANLTAARELADAGEPLRALQATRRRQYHWATNYLLSSSILLRARLAAQLGERDEAEEAYRHYIALHDDPEPSSAPRLEQARNELSRLLSDS
ncbi:MAG TPA: hypothetical protein VK837_00980 [Longimicrobiales bacterium]|nr:hypothetical protein [Longimicrobiales bacterium]